MAKAEVIEIAILPLAITSAITIELKSIPESGGAPEVEMPEFSIAP